MVCLAKIRAKKSIKSDFGFFLLQLLQIKIETVCSCLHTQWASIGFHVSANMCACVYVFVYESVCVFNYNENLNSYYIPTFLMANCRRR